VSGSGLSKIGHGSVLSFASGLLAPVFDAGRLKAKAAQRKAEARESLAVLEQAVLTAIREVEDALIRERLLFDEQRLLRIEIAIARDTVAKARLRYINGQESYLAVLTSLTELQALQQNEITLQQEMLINRGRLLKALGAKWSDYCETP
jgi:outer membrane protein TolC